MEPYGLGDLYRDWEIIQQLLLYTHQSQHFLEELTGNKFLVVVIIRQQLKMTELYGHGVIIQIVR